MRNEDEHIRFIISRSGVERGTASMTTVAVSMRAVSAGVKGRGIVNDVSSDVVDELFDD